jgi:Uncharacterized conserved protein
MTTRPPANAAPKSRPRLPLATATRRRGSAPLPPRLAAAWEYFLVILGCVITAGSFNLLLNGNRIVSGGLTGLSTLLHSRYGIEPAVTQAAVNLPLFLLGVLLLGGRFGAKTLLGGILLPLCVLLTRGLPLLTTDPLLASLYGGIATGVGLGLIFRGGGSVGGTSLAARLLSRFTGASVGAALLLCDGIIIGVAGLTLGAEQAMYGLISLFVAKRAIDVVLSGGLATSKLALVICREEAGVEAVRRAVIEEMDRGLTVLAGTGGFTGRDRPVLMVVISQGEVAQLKALVHSVDPGAFVVLSDAAEVLGQGFQQYRM